MTGRLWRWPVAIGLMSAGGLLAALMGDGWADAASWALLAVPVACALRGLVPAGRSGRVAASRHSSTHRP